jgi:hypothetical protein
MASIALNYALNNGMTQAQFDQRIFDYVAANIATKTPAELRIEMDRLQISPEDVARATGVSAADVKAQYAEALPDTRAEMIAKAAAEKELASRVAKDTTATQATKDIYNQSALLYQGLLGPGDQTAAATAAAALAAQQKAAADKLAADNAAASKATADAAAAAKAASDKAAADAAAIAASNATAAQKAAAAKAAADAKAASDAAATKAASDAAAAAAAKAATDGGLAAAAAAKAASDKAAADAAAIAASNATAAQKAAAAKAATDAAAAAAAAAAKTTTTTTTTGTQSPGLAYALNNGMTQQQYYQNIFNFYKNNSGLSDSMLRSEMDRLQISPQDVAAATGSSLESVLSRYNAAKATTAAELAAQQKAQADLAARQGQWADQQKANETAWAAQQAKNAADWAAQQKLMQNAQNAYANAPLTLGQKFGSYESIPIGAQYNPAVTPGGVSPYSMVMGQTTPFQNPYANFVPGTALGGYNPNLYNQIAVNNANAAAAKAAAETKAANDALMMSGAAGSGAGDAAGGGGAAGDAAATAAATAAANAANAAAAVTGESVSVSGETGESVSGVYNKGGIVDGLFGPNPPGPDDGAGLLDRGEYVIRKSAVNKYGRGLLDMINEGKVPAKKIRSLLD